MILPLGLNREGVLFETGDLLNSVTFSSIFLVRKSQIIHHNNTSISSSPSRPRQSAFQWESLQQYHPRVLRMDFTNGLKQWIWSSSSPTCAVVNAQDMNDFRMVSHEISFHALSIHSTMTFRGRGFIAIFFNLVCFFWFS